MREIYPETIVAWIIKIVCTKCKHSAEFTLSSGRFEPIQNLKEAEEAVPSDGFNGWDISKKNKEMCPGCAYDFKVKQNRIRRIRRRKNKGR